MRDMEVDHGSFSPLIFTPYGENSTETEQFIAELALNVEEEAGRIKHGSALAESKCMSIFTKICSIVLNRPFHSYSNLGSL